jgi:hypothetical protein
VALIIEVLAIVFLEVVVVILVVISEVICISFVSGCSTHKVDKIICCMLSELYAISSLACVASLVPPLALLGLGLVGFVSLVLVAASHIAGAALSQRVGLKC